ncbi:hypothetical protein A2631_02000 [Candidatus Daviesbacteria bacterium RIFCSPHIGHO2_01_FULL_44_29]|uniref:Uncharacterized protein n=1 Tax=Candidatus Daviesbacteria bacterium RIFCSPHIGHO2_02_FULL_43_12 TaxID=1797776 RepID=A0A1F5KK13_9BACT|nr:MAG: hypothetical protein A2631_02000 [Candidatus Daviesbacteria bacterium RIFCSPHIGHO2_01_FULL_44_29]OGE39555.1 MAG: hypothetical protein A3E86_01900 [Candidatus Daviesbacteria bacterium RIFCSPHIGHO2_12_FULL_47_45]OGE41169.1 MAG: hypothetical protein A3D25_01395 [Candidatus Daviesbacteria bacterium RIFCSPHIGHO2_02_FULL_43_12]OGE69368.1 MAG: hypothetical protein A3B55_03135 [Candidatus Daviesbacteria bacterium RIFCSPLOWO2_01_FULL_43_15]
MIGTYSQSDIVFNPSKSSIKSHELGFLIFLLVLVVSVFAFFYIGLNRVSQGDFGESIQREQTKDTPRFVSIVV